LWLALFMAVLIFIRHHANIRRLLKGEEPRIGSKAAPATAAASDA
jgi:glycerol-3-phosphate acyltransferase PlsY